MVKPNLFMLHFAGGSCYSYDFMAPYLKNTRTHALELPGRGRRMTEKMVDTIHDAKNDMLKQIQDKIVPNKSIIYGHSMGALLGFLVTIELEKRNTPPRQLIVSGNPGPMASHKKRIYEAPPEEFKAELKKLGGMPEEFFTTNELFEFYEPILRSDFKLAYEMSQQEDLVINTPIHAIMGTSEESCKNIQNWNKYTSVSFEFELMQGDHFFIFNNPQKIADIIMRYF